MLESDFFKRSRADHKKLERFGFKRTNGSFLYSENLPGDQFRAELTVETNGNVTGRIIDMDTNEEYLPIHYENSLGAFSGNIRELYFGFLEKIMRECFVPLSFIYDQANRIESMIAREFDSSAEFPWEKYPGNGTFKCNENGKWFAAILTVAFGKLQSAEIEPATPKQHEPQREIIHDDDEIIEVINLKADPDAIPELLQRPGIYTAWHMNKTHWISVILNDTLTDDEIFELIAESYRLVCDGKPSKVKSTGAWMIPSNPKIYDVDAGFRDGGGIIDWHQHNNIHAGDEVFIYSSAPYSALMYRCEVVEADIDYKGMFHDSKGYKKAMRIRLIEKYTPDRYPLSFIKEHGGSVVRSARTMPKELYEAVIY